MSAVCVGLQHQEPKIQVSSTTRENVPNDVASTLPVARAVPQKLLLVGKLRYPLHGRRRGHAMVTHVVGHALCEGAVLGQDKQNVTPVRPRRHLQKYKKKLLGNMNRRSYCVLD